MLTKEGNPQRLYRIGNKEMTLTEWAREYSMDPSTVRSRVRKHGWSLMDALTTPVNGRRTGERKCGKCIYGTKYSGNWGCQYILITRKMRKSKVTECDKYVQGIPLTKQEPVRMVI